MKSVESGSLREGSLKDCFALLFVSKMLFENGGVVVNWRSVVVTIGFTFAIIASKKVIADTIISGDLKIRDGGEIFFSDGSVQSKAQIQGPQGVQGPIGPAGSINTLTIGTILSDISAAATITGSAPKQVLNLTLPQGPQGIQGPPGPVGPGGYSFPWRKVTDSFTASSNNGYLTAGVVSPVVLTLPTSAGIGDLVRVFGASTTGWQVNPPVSGLIDFGTMVQSWRSSGPQLDWGAITSSADGTKLAATTHYGQIYTSSDSGVTWNPRGPSQGWYDITTSADGIKLAAVQTNGQIYTSADSGVTWTPRDSTRYWQAITSSADGTKLAAVAEQIYTSTDSGVTWTPRNSMVSGSCIASSADGTKLAAGTYGDQIYTSTDSGVTWTPRGSTKNWYGIASSADGTKLVALANSDQIYTSTDSGVTWFPRDSIRNWYCVASSSDGTKLVATTHDGQIYTSTNSGITWAPQELSRSWIGVATSADGTKLAAVDNNGQIYFSPPNLGSPSYLSGGFGASAELICTSTSPVTFMILVSNGRVFPQ